MAQIFQNIIDVVRCRANEFGTFGRLFLNDVFVCYTLEPAPSLHKPRPIPIGTYRLRLDRVSPKFRYRAPYTRYKGCVPYLEKVEDFEGVLIHIGNFLKDTSGCILVGEQASLRRLYRSTSAWLKLMSLLDKNIVTYIRIGTTAIRPLAVDCSRKSKRTQFFSEPELTSSLKAQIEYDFTCEDLPF